MKLSYYTSLFFILILLAPSSALAHKKDMSYDTNQGFFEQYSWFEIINPFLLITLIAIYAVYLKWVNRSAQKSLWKHKLYFGLGLLTIYSVLAGPVAIMANNLVVSVHMLQQSMMYIVMPPLILLGLPADRVGKIANRLLQNKFFDKWLTAPLLTLFLFNMLWSFYHIPVIYEFALENFLFLEFVHLITNFSAFLMWLQVVPPVRKLSKLSHLKRIGYMFANGMLITPACALIIFSDTLLYPSLLEAPRLFGLSELQDQKTGGIVMKVVQEVSYGFVITYIFYKWVREEKDREAKGLVTPNIRITEN